MLAGICGSVGIQLAKESGFGSRSGSGLNRKQSTCLVSIAPSHECVCMWLPVRFPRVRPVVSHSFVQSLNRKLYRLTHIYLMVLSSCQPCTLARRVSLETPALLHFHDTCKFPAGTHPQLTPRFHEQWYIHPHPVLCETRSRRAPLKSFDAVIWQFLADFSLTFGFDQLI